MIVNALKSSLIASLIIFIWTIVSDYVHLDANLKQNLGSFIRTIVFLVFVLINSKKSKCHPLSIASFQYMLMLVLTSFLLANTWEWIYKNIFF